MRARKGYRPFYRLRRKFNKKALCLDADSLVLGFMGYSLIFPLNAIIKPPVKTIRLW